MQKRIIAIGIALVTAAALAGCAPGPDGYAGWSQARQHQADRHAYASQRDAAAAQWEAARGNYYGAQQAQAAASDQAARAQAAQDHADRDRFLSQF